MSNGYKVKINESFVVRPSRKKSFSEIIAMVPMSESYPDLARRLGYSSSHSRYLKQVIEFMKIDISHFKTTSELLSISAKRGSRRITSGLFDGCNFTPRVKELFSKTERGKNYQCEFCGNKGIHNESKLVLELDHINGRRTDNQENNLRWLCPNCHSQTSTYCGRNRARR